MCCTFSLLDVEWKLCAHTTTNVQTSKLAQRYTILACAVGISGVSIVDLSFSNCFFLKYLMKAQKAVFTSVFELTYLSFGYRVETERTHCKRPTNIKTYTMLYYISVLLVSVV